MEQAARLVARLTALEQTVAVAESLTGGLVASALTDIPGASAVLRGGVTAYATDIKAQVLGVDEVLLATTGSVDAEVAEQMASGVRSLMGATYGLSTTGAAGPDPVDGKPVGMVYVAVVGPGSSRVKVLGLTGDRSGIRAQSVVAALALLAEELDAQAREEPPGAHG